MIRQKPLIVVCLLLLLLLIPCGQGATQLLVSVYEQTENVTHIPYASVYVNGALSGKTDQDGTLVITHPGTATLEVTVVKPGYDEWTGVAGKNQSILQASLVRSGLLLNASVFDSDTLVPIANATVTVVGANQSRSMETGAAGNATFAVLANNLYTVTVGAPNYQARSSSVDIGIKGKTVQFPLVRDDRFSIVAKGALDMEPVANADVYIDNQLKGTTDSRGIVALQIPRDKVYYIAVKKPGYQDYLEKRLINSDEAVVTAFMTRADYQVFISVFGEDRRPIEGAEVYINGALRGNTSAYGRHEVTDLESGTYPVEIRFPGYVTVKRSIVVAEQGQDVVVDLEYVRTDVIIRVQDGGGGLVEGASVAVDSVPVGMTDYKGEVRTKLRVNVPLAITATKEGYNPGKTTKTFAPDTRVQTVTVVVEQMLNLMLIGLAVGIVVLVLIVVIILLRHRTRRPAGGGRRGEI